MAETRAAGRTSASWLGSAASFLTAATRGIASRFLEIRGTHLAAMISYFALLAFVPLLFLSLSLIGLIGQQDESSRLIQHLRDTFPETSVDHLVRAVETIRSRAVPLGVIGGFFLIWAALGLFSVLESAFNVVYGVANRRFAHGKGLMLVAAVASIVVLFVSLAAGSLGVEILDRVGVDARWLRYVAAIAVSTALVFVLVAGAYRFLTNLRLGWRDVLPGTAFATVLLQASFQLVPIYARATDSFVALQAFGGLVLLLVWLYLMANFLVLGAVANWWIPRWRSR